MKYILIRGTADSGKSTTIDAVCKRLNPTVVYLLNYLERKRFEPVPVTVDFINGTYVIEVNGKIILVVTSAPTEQKITITILIEMCIKFKVKIDFALVAMRSFETREDHDTSNELAKYGECIYDERIWKIDAENFRETVEWQNRIKGIVDLIDLK